MSDITVTVKVGRHHLTLPSGTRHRVPENVPNHIVHTLLFVVTVQHWNCNKLYISYSLANRTRFCFTSSLPSVFIFSLVPKPASEVRDVIWSFFPQKAELAFNFGSCAIPKKNKQTLNVKHEKH